MDIMKIYYSVDQMTWEWAKVQDCDLNSQERVITPYDDWVTHPETKGYNLKCYEYTKGCAARVINCAFYGTHFKYASFDARLAYWFFSGELGIGWNESSLPGNDSEEGGDLYPSIMPMEHSESSTILTDETSKSISAAII